jgi:UDP-N-acetylenolpyruvoylglucosamine reductase
MNSLTPNLGSPARSHATHTAHLAGRFAAEAVLLAARLAPESVVRVNEPLARRTTLRVGGPADLFVEPASEADLATTLRLCAERGLPRFILGRGSNLLVRDGGVRGAVVSLAHLAFAQLAVKGERLHCGAGVRLKHVANEARRHALAGLEFLEGIPGSVGGALRMNAGAMGGWMFDVVESVRFMDDHGAVHERARQEIEVSYRCCPLLCAQVALGAVLRGTPGDRVVIEDRMSGFSLKRWGSQPAAASAGCIFKNPEAIPAGKLIDELGLKGTRVGAAKVSVEHGNFIVNEGGATGADMLALIELIRRRALDERGITLETEVEIVGEDADK